MTIELLIIIALLALCAIGILISAMSAIAEKQFKNTKVTDRDYARKAAMYSHFMGGK